MKIIDTGNGGYVVAWDSQQFKLVVVTRDLGGAIDLSSYRFSPDGMQITRWVTGTEGFKQFVYSQRTDLALRVILPPNIAPLLTVDYPVGGFLQTIEISNVVPSSWSGDCWRNNQPLDSICGYGQVCIRGGNYQGPGSHPSGCDGYHCCQPNWQCLPGIDVPLSLHPVTENVQCLVKYVGSSNCDWGNCQAKLVRPFQNLMPGFSCGSQHKNVYGVTGYDVPSHWCAKAKGPLGYIQWVCLSGIDFPVAVLNGDVQCLTIDGKNCVSATTINNLFQPQKSVCSSLLDANFGYALPWSCGKTYPGGTGYDQFAWCRAAKAALVNYLPYRYSQAEVQKIQQGQSEASVCTGSGGVFTQGQNYNYPGCGSAAWCCRQASYVAYGYTQDERQKINQGQSEASVCVGAGGVFTQGQNSNYPGCGTVAWCCRPAQSAPPAFRSVNLKNELQESLTP
jgi:hypothetical protein